MDIVPKFKILRSMVALECQYCGEKNDASWFPVSHPYGDCFVFCEKPSCRQVGKYVVLRERKEQRVLWAPRDSDIYRMLGFVGGGKYNVIRSSGCSDGGWDVPVLEASRSVPIEDMPHIITGGVLLSKVIDGEVCTRRCKLSELVSVNPCMPRDAVAILEREIARLVEEARPAAEALFQQAIRVEKCDGF